MQQDGALPQDGNNISVIPSPKKYFQLATLGLIFVHKGDEPGREWRQQPNEVLHDLFPSGRVVGEG